ncbi:hypothetical protein [Leptolyngbya sp. FACHB-16]|nr:hypothetical protein [Leptolyngbya sp. FACHB-16]MBD1913421.1 hypothetical protein [Leptolyngbya sp. FACHB-8]MBD2155816.1 hypothetical protein [Leptolyngbya sp. FACHB-16]
MVMQTFTYESVWRDSQKVNWRVDDLIGPDKPLDFTKRFLPESLARVEELTCLNPKEQLILNHIRGNSYLHLFVLVEAFIIPMVLDQVKRMGYENIFAAQALLGFAEEEGKHIHLFQQFAKAFEQGFGSPCLCISPPEKIAAAILDRHPLGVLLLTLQFEWTTQSHYLESVRNNNEDLDPRFCDLLKYHWLEEAQHTRLDTLLVCELTQVLEPSMIEQVMEDYLKAVHLLHNTLMQQAQLDLQSLEQAIGRSLSPPERDTILAGQEQAYRWGFLCAGLTHPNFIGVLGNLSPSYKTRVTELAKTWS